MTGKLNLIGYVRVSTLKQLEGHSLDNQTEVIENYCKAKNYNLKRIYKDKGISAFKDRPEFNAAMKELSENETSMAWLSTTLHGSAEAPWIC